MRKTISVLILIFLLVCSLVSCGGGKGGASDTVETFFDAAHRGEIDKAFECVAIENPAAPSENYILSLEGMIKETKIVSEETHREKYNDYEFEVAEVEADVYFLPEKQEYEKAGMIYRVHLARLVTGKKADWKIEYIKTEGVIEAGESVIVEEKETSSRQASEQGGRPDRKEVYFFSDFSADSPLRNPKEPEQVVVAFYFFIREGSCREAAGLIAGATEQETEEWIKLCEEEYQTVDPYKIEVEEVDNKGDKIEVTVLVSPEKGNLFKKKGSVVYENGKWKLGAYSDS